MNPHFGHLYFRLNCLHFEQRQIVISPQLGHENEIAFVPGGIILLHDVQIGIAGFLLKSSCTSWSILAYLGCIISYASIYSFLIFNFIFILKMVKSPLKLWVKI